MPVRKARRHTMCPYASRRGREIWPKRMYIFVIRSSFDFNVKNCSFAQAKRPPAVGQGPSQTARR